LFWDVGPFWNYMALWSPEIIPFKWQTPLSTFLLKQLTLTQAVTNGTQEFIPTFTRACQWTESWAKWIQSIWSHPISLRAISISFTHLCLAAQQALFFSDLSTKVMHTFSFSPILATWNTNLICLHQFMLDTDLQCERHESCKGTTLERRRLPTVAPTLERSLDPSAVMTHRMPFYSCPSQHSTACLQAMNTVMQPHLDPNLKELYQTLLQMSGLEHYTETSE
jgi:hypothetical protein